MNEIRLEVEAITPVFVAGADQRNITNEGLRASTLRGLMRWWVRASMGGVMWDRGDFDLNKLSEYETKIFGSQSKKSSIAIMTRGPGIGAILEYDANRFSQPINYFFFSLKRTRTSAPRSYIKEGTHLQIVLRGNEQSVNTSLAALWLMINLGGAGSRSRRFGGQLKETSSLVRNMDQELRVSFAPKNGESYDLFLKNNIESIQKYLSKQIDASPSNKSSSGIPPFPMIVRNCFSILVRRHEGASSWKDVVQELANIWSGAFDPRQRRVVGGIRKQFADDEFSQQIKKSLSSNISSLPKQCNERRPFIGLPLNYFFMDLRPPKGIELTAQGRYEYVRRASSISFGLAKVDEVFYSRVVIFKSAFLPDTHVEWKLSGLNRSIQMPSTSDMNQILSKVESDLCAAGWTKVRIM